MAKNFSINDPIHSRVFLSEIEQSVIGHPIFQRLRRIKALGLLEKVFPSARHSRFEHSIGACHVAKRALDSLERNQNDICKLALWVENDQYKPWEELSDFLTQPRKQQIRLAALLHDVGHGPFSHGSEGLMPNRKSLLDNNPELPEYIKKALVELGVGDEDLADHEDYSLLLAWRILSDIECRHSDMDPSFIQDVLSFKFETLEPANGVNKEIFDLFRNFVDGDFDGDRMDYLLRDSYFCGVPYGQYDLNRLLEGLYVLQKGDNLVMGIKESSLAAFEDFLMARFQMHSQVYTHRIDVCYNTALKALTKLSGKFLPSTIDEYAEIDDESFLYHPEFSSISELKPLLLDRKKWVLVHQESKGDGLVSESLFKTIQDTFGDDKSCYDKGKEKELRKGRVLQVPIVRRDRRTRKLSTSDLSELGNMLANGEGIKYFSRKIFVHPSIEEKAKFMIGEGLKVSEKKTEAMHKAHKKEKQSGNQSDTESA